jgi:hypothetical protein
MYRAKYIGIRSRRTGSCDGVPTRWKDESHTLNMSAPYFVVMVTVVAVFSVNYMLRLKKELRNQHIIQLKDLFL